MKIYPVILLDVLGIDDGLFIMCCIVVFILLIIGIHYLIASATRSKEILEQLKKLNGEKDKPDGN